MSGVNGRPDYGVLESSGRKKAHRGGLFCGGRFNECPVMRSVASSNTYGSDFRGRENLSR